MSSAFKIAFENGLPSVELPEMDDDTIEFFLQFVYSGRLSLPKEFEQYDKLSALLFSLQNLGIEVNSIENSAFEIDRFDLSIVFVYFVDDSRGIFHDSRKSI